jgi:Circularly permutated YpsA SLOG family
MLKIISGGQTGVDRAALDAAIARGALYGGWCPKGGWAEDMPQPPGLLACYPYLQETPLSDPNQRTEWNVRDSDRLMVLVDERGLNSPGTELAIRTAYQLQKQALAIDLDATADVGRAAAWFYEGRQMSLVICIAGPRESEAPGIYAKAKAFLQSMLA